jgi:hypothetical protein
MRIKTFEMQRQWRKQRNSEIGDLRMGLEMTKAISSDEGQKICARKSKQ